MTNKSLEQLADIARGTGARVEFKPDCPELGKCDYVNKIIYINSGEDERKQILILAHEVGHWLSYLEHGKNKSLRRNDRERLAYEQGWRLLVNLGLHKKHNINKDEWEELNLRNYHNFDPDTKGEGWT